MQRALIVSVASVSVSSDLAKDNGFANDLDSALEQSVGRTNRDIGQSVRLRVFVRENSKAISGYNAVVDIELTSLETGRILYTGMSRKFGSTRPALIEVIVYDVRRLVGVSGSIPVAVYTLKKPVVRPESRPIDADLAEAISVADPLLNGTFTPGSEVRDAEAPLSEPLVIDTSKPLLAKEALGPKNAPANAGVVVKSAKPEMAPIKTAVPEAKPFSSPPEVETDNSAADEPCVVTINNDCKNPDE